jgi:hypothetical protein
MTRKVPFLKPGARLYTLGTIAHYRRTLGLCI